MFNIRNVIITGFGVFRSHQINESWEAIKDGLKIDRPNVNLIVKHINVSYQDVDKAVSTLWKQYDPLLMIHVGLAAHERAIRIEQVARHGPYIHDDVLKFAPHRELRYYGDEEEEKSSEENIIKKSYSCKPCKFDSSQTCLNIDQVCDKLNQAFENHRVPIPTKKSKDAGLYVCEYIYSRSLTICDRAVFIHVPSSENFKLEDIKTNLQYSIELLIDEATRITSIVEH